MDETRLRVFISGSVFSALLRFGSRVLLRAKCGLLPGTYLLSSNPTVAATFDRDMFFDISYLADWSEMGKKQVQVDESDLVNNQNWTYFDYRIRSKVVRTTVYTARLKTLLLAHIQ